MDRITLTVPATSEYAKAVRMLASALANRMGMTYDQLDDVRIAAEEAFVYGSDTAPEGGEVTIIFGIDESAIEIEVPLGDSMRIDDEEAERRASYATFILQAVCDRFELSSDESGSHLRVVKNCIAESDDAR